FEPIFDGPFSASSIRYDLSAISRCKTILGTDIAINPLGNATNHIRSHGNTDDVPVPSAASLRERQVMEQEEVPIRPRDLLKVIPFHAVRTSARLGWAGLEAARFRASPAWEYNAPALTCHRLVLVTRPPQELDLRFDGMKRHVPLPTGAI